MLDSSDQHTTFYEPGRKSMVYIGCVWLFLINSASGRFGWNDCMVETLT